MPQKYRVTTDQGTYEVTVEDPAPSQAEPQWYQPGGDVLLDNIRAAAALPGKAFNAIRRHPAEAGAMLGGALAVPATGGASLLPAMAAAGLGGAGGAGLGMLTSAALDPSSPAPTTSAGVLGTMAKEGAIQAGAEGTGRVISGALKKMAPRLYQSALKPTLAARAEHPDLVETGLREGIPVSTGGAEKAGTLMAASKDAADTLVNTAARQPNPAMIDPTQAVSGITSAIKDMKDLPVARPQMRAIGDYARQYLTEHPGQMPLDQAQRAVRATDAYYNPVYRSLIDRGNPVTSGHTAAALGINDETRQLLRQAVPGLQATNAQTQALEGLRQAVERRVGMLGNNSPIGMQHLINTGLAAGMGSLGGPSRGIGSLLGLEALTYPPVASRLAIGASRAAPLNYAQAIRAALLARLAGDQQDQGDEQPR